MAKKSKLELIMELGDKLFNNKLTQVQAKLSNATDKMEGKLKRFNLTQIKIFSNIGETFKPERINQAFELFDSLSQKLDFSKDIKNTELALKQMGVNENLDKVSAKVNELKNVYGDNSLEIAKAANAMTKELGGSFETNLAILEQGYQKGSNLNGDMIDQFKEYPAQIKQLGLNAEQMMVIMANAGKQGIFSDKAIDSIKEANLSLKEMGPAQVDALKGIGIEVKDLAGKTSFEAVQMIAKAMEGASAQAKQLALTDIFKGAGEDAGMSFIVGLGSMDLDPNNIPSFQAADAEMKSWTAKFESYMADMLGNLPIEKIASWSMTLMGLISIITTLNSSVGLATAAQWLWNAAMTANPIGLIIAGIAALIGMVVLAINKWDEWGAGLLFFLGPIGLVIGMFKSLYDHWESIKEAFKTDGILGGLKRIGIVLLDALLKPVQQLLEMLSKIPGLGSLAKIGADKINSIRENLDLITPGEKEAKTATNTPEQKKPADSFYKAPTIDGLIKDDKTKSTKHGDNVEKVAGQANQVRKIDIKIDSFNKGGINMAPSDVKGLTLAEVEAWFKEAMMRVILNAENA